MLLVTVTMAAARRRYGWCMDGPPFESTTVKNTNVDYLVGREVTPLFAYFSTLTFNLSSMTLPLYLVVGKRFRYTDLYALQPQRAITPGERARSTSPAKSEKEEGEVTGTAPLPTEAVPDYSGWQWMYSGTAGWWWAYDYSQQCYVWYDSTTMAYTYTAPIPYDQQASSSVGGFFYSNECPSARY